MPPSNISPIVIQTDGGTEAMRVDPTGNVGIGTSTPSDKLNVDPQGPGGITIGNPNTGQGGFTSLILDISAASGGYAWLQAIKASGTQWGDLALNPYSGNVGIGTTSPGALLEIASPSNYGVIPKLRLTDNYAGGRTWEVQSGIAGVSDAYFGIKDVTDNLQALTITHQGNVGIGTSSPAATLDVNGSISASNGVTGAGGQGFGVSGHANNVGVYAHNDDVPGNDAYLASRCCAGDFYGPVYVHGTATTVTVEGTLQVDSQLIKPGGQFQIDHPLDPARKYLSHSFVESPDMKNIYDGVVVLDAQGEAEVELPVWFEALNQDFRYQLTCIGGYAPVYIAQEIHNNRFAIAGGKVGMKVSWQVTGIRQDAWANAHRIPVEEDKSAEEQGYYLHPELYGESEEKHVRQVRHPEMIKLMRQRKQMQEGS